MPVRYVDKDGVVRSRLPQAAGTDLQAGDANRRRADRVRNVDYSKIGNQATPKGTSATPAKGGAMRNALNQLGGKLNSPGSPGRIALGARALTGIGAATYSGALNPTESGRPMDYGREWFNTGQPEATEFGFRQNDFDPDWDIPTNPLTGGGRSAIGMGSDAVGDAGQIIRENRIPQNRPLVNVPDFEAARERSATGRPGMGQVLPREYQPSEQFPGYWDSGVAGIGVRPGADSALEFFDAGRVDNPIRSGELTVMPAQAMMQQGIPDNSAAIRAAAARGDWGALERVGAISPRSGGTGGGGGGYGGGYGGRRSDLVSEGAGMVREAQRLMQQAARSNRAFERSGLIRQADALMEGAKSLGSFGLKEDELAGENARLAAASRGEPVDPTVAMKNIAQAGLFDAQRVKALTESRQLSPQLLTALSAIGDGRAAELQELYLSNAQTQVIQDMAAGIQQITTPEQLVAQLEQGIYRETPDLELLLAGAARDQGFDITIGNEEEEQGFFGRARGLVEGRAMGGLIEDEPMGFADGGFVDPMMSAMGGYGMEESLGPMGAMGMSGGMGRPDMLQVEYSQYMQGAQKLGLPQIPFEEFVALKQQQIPQAPQAPDLTQPMGAMGFADGGFVQTKNQFGYNIDPQTGRSPVGQASMDRHSAAVRSNNALRQQQAGPQPAAQPMAQPAARPAAQPAQFGGNANYGQLATSFGMNTGAVQSIRDQARTAGTVPSFGDGKPSMMSQFGATPTSFMDRKAFARGGPVDTGGKMVIDPNPNAPTDSIPAVIDGQRPAALDSGEFVIPKHAVMFHGVDKLNKLIAQAEKGPGDGINA